MIIGIDIDGVLTKKDWTITFPDFFNYFVYIVYWIVPKSIRQYIKNAETQEGIEKLRELCSEHEIVIITARPKFLHKETQAWLDEHLSVPIHKLYCVGLMPGIEERKYEKASESGVEVFIDNRPQTVAYFNERQIKAIQFANWDQVQLGDIC